MGVGVVAVGIVEVLRDETKSGDLAEILLAAKSVSDYQKAEKVGGASNL